MAKNVSIDDCLKILEELNAEIVDLYFPLIVLLGITVIFGGIGNCTVAYVYYHKFEISSTEIFLVALAMSDFATCIICIPMEIVILYFPVTFHSDIACRLMRYTVSTAIVMSAYITCIIAIDKYTRICRVFNQHISVKGSKQILAFLIIAAAITTILIPFVYCKNKIMVKHCGNIGEVCSLSDSSNLVLPYYIFLNSGNSCAYFLVVILYLLTGIRIWKLYKTNSFLRQKLGSIFNTFITRSTVSGSALELFSSRRSRRQPMHPYRTSFILFIITMGWIISYVPHFSAVFLKLSTNVFNETASHKIVIYKFLMCSFYTNSVLNPYIYGLFSRRFRAELNSIFRGLSQT